MTPLWKPSIQYSFIIADLEVCGTCVTYEPSKWLGSLPISVSVSLYSTLSSLLILAVCRTCVKYEPSKWLSSLTISVSLSLYSTLSSLLILEVCRTCVTYEPSKWLGSLPISVSVLKERNYYEVELHFISALPF